MPTIRSFTNTFEVVDQTASLLKVPQTWTLLGDSGLFVDEPLTTQVATFQEINGSLSVIGDSIRGSKPQAMGGDVRKMHSYSLSHHQFVDSLYPEDIAGKSSYSDISQEESEAGALLKKMEKARRSFDVTKEIARFRTLGTGTVWSPNGTIAGNFYSDFGITRKQVDFVLGTATTDVVAKCEEIIASFQANADGGEIITGVTAYASPTFFAALIAHAKVQVSYTNQTLAMGANIQRERAGGMGLYRRFNFAGINFIEVPTILAGTSLVTAGDCIFVAEGTDNGFVTYYGPANRFGFVGSRAETSYLWTQRMPDLKEIRIEGEFNMLNVLRKPAMVARGYTS